MNDKDKLRIGDSDRELVSRLLKSAVDEGRLSLTEYDERLQQVYEAKTVGDLDPITGDLISGRGVLAVNAQGALSAQSPPGEAGSARSASGRRRTPVWIRWMWFGWLTPVSVCTVIWLISVLVGGADVYFWPVWVAGPLGAVMGSVTLMERLMIRPVLEERDRSRTAQREYSTG